MWCTLKCTTCAMYNLVPNCTTESQSVSLISLTTCWKAREPGNETIILSSLVSRPIPSFSLLYAEKWEGLHGIRSPHTILHPDDAKIKRSLQKVNLCKPHAYFTWLFSYYASKPYLKLMIVNGSALSFTDLLLIHFHFHPLTTLHMDKISHVTSDTRPSYFFHATLGGVGDEAKSYCGADTIVVIHKAYVSECHAWYTIIFLFRSKKTSLMNRIGLNYLRYNGNKYVTIATSNWYWLVGQKFGTNAQLFDSDTVRYSLFPTSFRSQLKHIDNATLLHVICSER